MCIKVTVQNCTSNHERLISFWHIKLFFSIDKFWQLIPANHYNNYNPRPALTQLTPANHHNHYIPHPALTQLTPANRHNHYIPHPALTQLTPANHYNPCPALTQLYPANYHNHYPITVWSHTSTHHTISDTLSPCTCTNSSHYHCSLCISVTITTLSKRLSLSDSRQSNRMYRQIISVLYKPYSLLGKSVHQT